MFVHGGWLHLLFNMWYLWIFGNNVEDAMTRPRFVVFYFVCGMAATTAQVLVVPLSDVPLIGASGAIAGVLGGVPGALPARQGAHRDPAHHRLAGVRGAGLDPARSSGSCCRASAAAQSFGSGEAGVAFFAHLGGFVAGMLLVLLFARRRRGPGAAPQAHGAGCKLARTGSRNGGPGPLMIADHHIHTRLCRHAEGEPREYVERAIELGMTEMGFADHLPFLGGWEPRHDLTDDWAMRPDELDDYVALVQELAREYEGDVRIILGIEADFIPETLELTAATLEQYPFEYVIGSVHIVGDRFGFDHPEMEGRLADYGSTASTSKASSWPGRRPRAGSSTSSATSTTRASSGRRRTRRRSRPPRPRRCAPWRRPA